MFPPNLDQSSGLFLPNTLVLFFHWSSVMRGATNPAQISPMGFAGLPDPHVILLFSTEYFVVSPVIYIVPCPTSLTLTFFSFFRVIFEFLIDDSSKPFCLDLGTFFAKKGLRSIDQTGSTNTLCRKSKYIEVSWGMVLFFLLNRSMACHRLSIAKARQLLLITDEKLSRSWFCRTSALKKKLPLLRSQPPKKLTCLMSAPRCCTNVMEMRLENQTTKGSSRNHHADKNPANLNLAGHRGR